MGERINRYPWDSPWAPRGAQTDSPPNSAQRLLLDLLTDPDGDYRIPPEEIDKGYQISRGKWEPGEANNNFYRFVEALEFIDQTPNGWKRFRPALDAIDLIDPIDPRRLPDPVKQRIENLQQLIEAEIKLKPEDSGYCRHFVPRFFNRGQASFQKGGLCFAKESKDPIDFPIEATAAQAFQACVDDTIARGQCSETTYKILAAFEYLGICQPYAVSLFYPNAQSNHLFGEFLGKELDPTQIGRKEMSWGKGFARELTHRQLIAVYYINLADPQRPLQSVFLNETTELWIDPISAGQMAVSIDPESPEAQNNLGAALLARNYSEGAVQGFKKALQLRQGSHKIHYNLGVSLKQRGDLDGAVSELQRSLELNSDDVDAHTHLGIAYYLKRDLDAAFREFRRAMDLKPCDPLILTGFRTVFREREEGAMQFLASLNPFFRVK